MRDVTYDPATDVYRYAVDEDEPVADAVVRAVAVVTDQEPLDVGPLYEAVDPDALESVVESLHGAERTEWSVEFSFERCHVTVTGDGSIELTLDPSSPDGPGERPDTL